MNTYRVAMFKAYWGPITLFYGLACLILMTFGPFWRTDDLTTLMVPAGILFITGYFLAPIMGPKVKNNKLASFIMGYSFLATFTLVWVLILTQLKDVAPKDILFSVLFIFIYGSFPIIISAAFFIRFCNAMPDDS